MRWGPYAGPIDEWYYVNDEDQHGMKVMITKKEPAKMGWEYLGDL